MYIHILRYICIYIYVHICTYICSYVSIFLGLVIAHVQKQVYYPAYTHRKIQAPNHSRTEDEAETDFIVDDPWFATVPGLKTFAARATALRSETL